VIDPGTVTAYSSWGYVYANADGAGGYWGTPFVADIDTTGLIPAGATYVSESCGYNLIYLSTNPYQDGDTIGCSVGAFNNNGTTEVTAFINPNYWNANGQGVAFNDEAELDSVYVSVNLQPGPMTLVSPANGATMVSTTPTLTWQEDVGYDYYCINLGTSSPPPGVGCNQPGDDSYTPSSPLAAGATYYWTVTAFTDPGASSTSRVWQFTTAPPQPTQATVTIQTSPAACRSRPEALPRARRTRGRAAAGALRWV
jgi:hypothetical protein